MFNTNDIPRTFTRDSWTRLYQIMRKVGSRGSTTDDSILAERAEIAPHLRACHENGKVAIVQSGMGCDCVKYCHSSIYDGMTAIQFQRERDSAYEWADGPIGIRFCRPSETPDSYSRDLAMEAYEDGHPHVVYA